MFQGNFACKGCSSWPRLWLSPWQLSEGNIMPRECVHEQGMQKTLQGRDEHGQDVRKQPHPPGVAQDLKGRPCLVPRHLTAGLRATQGSPQNSVHHTLMNCTFTVRFLNLDSLTVTGTWSEVRLPEVTSSLELALPWSWQNLSCRTPPS